MFAMPGLTYNEKEMNDTIQITIISFIFFTLIALFKPTQTLTNIDTHRLLQSLVIFTINW